MRILILTALFPPDVSPTATYVKDLAAHLSTDHTVTVLTFGYLPEKIAGVTVTCIDKRQSLIGRLASFQKTLRRELSACDLVVVNNGPSVELPLLISNSCVPYVYIISDQSAFESTNVPQVFLRDRTNKKATKVIQLPAEDTYLKPEQLPFTDNASVATAYTIWWQQHLKEITV
jgi:hypothetical protein